jgi:hypothetical protein
MPEYPHKARILKPIERKYAVWRLEREAGAGEATEEQSTLDSFKQAFLDPKIWALVWCMGMSQAMGSTNNFFPSIVQSLGYNKSNTMLLTAPPMVLAAICCYLVSWYSDVSLHTRLRSSGSCRTLTNGFYHSVKTLSFQSSAQLSLLLSLRTSSPLPL